MDRFKYNNYGQMMTGFDNSIDRSLYGHWRNTEYQEYQQLANMTDEEYQLYLKKQNQKVEYKPNDIDDDLPF